MFNVKDEWKWMGLTGLMMLVFAMGVATGSVIDGSDQAVAELLRG